MEAQQNVHLSFNRGVNFGNKTLESVDIRFTFKIKDTDLIQRHYYTSHEWLDADGHFWVEY